MKTLSQIEQDVIHCTKCKLHTFRTHAVPGEGNHEAELLFIGEGPGQREDELGRPFVGAAGKFLDELLSGIGLSRDDVFIANTVKCRPPNNRDPEDVEKAACWPHLEQQIHAIKPRLIVLLGKHALNTFIPDIKISACHGECKVYKGIHKEKQPYLPLYHPAAALYNGGLRQVLIDDFKRIPKILKKLKEEGY